MFVVLWFIKAEEMSACCSDRDRRSFSPTGEESFQFCTTSPLVLCFKAALINIIIRTIDHMPMYYVKRIITLRSFLALF